MELITVYFEREDRLRGEREGRVGERGISCDFIFSGGCLRGLKLFGGAFSGKSCGAACCGEGDFVGFFSWGFSHCLFFCREFGLGTQFFFLVFLHAFFSF